MIREAPPGPTKVTKWQLRCRYNSSFMKFWRSLALLFALAAAAVGQSTFSPPAAQPGTLGGGSAADDNADTTTTIVKTVNEVNLVFTVTDRHGHFIKDLKRDDVKVLDVRTVNVPGKPRRTRSGEKTTGEWKKAIVKLHPDHKIDLF